MPVLDDTFTELFGSGDLGPVPSLLLWTLGALLVSHVVYRKTTFGRELLATGGNRIAARYSGIDTDRIRIAVAGHLLVHGEPRRDCSTWAGSTAPATPWARPTC